ncbi:MAG: zinc chelation protein SecC [bacterium]|nr:zinc chelation protein SecC [bacterium]
MKKIGRNKPCPCGSGKKFKKCCLLRPDAFQNPSSPPPSFIPVYTPLDRMSNSVWDLIKKNKLDKAESVARKLLVEYPDQIDGLHRLAEVYEARGEKLKAAQYYRKAADFALSIEGFDKQSVDRYLSDARRMESKK